MRLGVQSKFEERMLPMTTVLCLCAFFFFGLLWPLAGSLFEALQDPPIQAALLPNRSLEELAGKHGISERLLREWNGLKPGEVPAAGTQLTVHPGRWTLAHLLGLFAPDAPQWRWILNSLLLATIVTGICILLTYPLAYFQVRSRFSGQALLGGLLLMPLILPPFVGAIGLRRMLAKYGTVNLTLMDLGLIPEDAPIDFLGAYRMVGCVVVMVLHFYPLLYLNLAASIGSIDPSLIESARSLGLNTWQIFRRVVFPLSVPGLVAGGSLVFVGAFTDLGTPLIFAYQEVVAQQIFSMANEQSANPASHALVAVVTLIVLLLFALTRIVVNRSPGGGGTKGTSRAAEKRLSAPIACVAIGIHLFVIALALLPHAAVFLAGLAERWVFTALPESYTTAHLQEALAHPIAQIGIWNSLLFATGSTLIDVVLGLACAWVIVRKGGIWGRVLDYLTMAPLAIPGIVLAFGYVALYADLYQGEHAVMAVGWFLVLGYAVRRLPYTTRACTAGLEQMPRQVEEAASGLGSTRLEVLRRITLPLISGSVIAGAILAFSFAMLEVAESLILANRPADFPLTKAIYYLFGRPGDGDQLASALGLFALFFMASALLAASAILGQKWSRLFRG